MKKSFKKIQITFFTFLSLAFSNMQVQAKTFTEVLYNHVIEFKEPIKADGSQVSVDLNPKVVIGGVTGLVTGLGASTAIEKMQDDATMEIETIKIILEVADEQEKAELLDKVKDLEKKLNRLKVAKLISSLTTGAGAVTVVGSVGHALYKSGGVAEVTKTSFGNGLRKVGIVAANAAEQLVSMMAHNAATASISKGYDSLKSKLPKSFIDKFNSATSKIDSGINKFTGLFTSPLDRSVEKLIKSLKLSDFANKKIREAIAYKLEGAARSISYRFCVETLKSAVKAGVINKSSGDKVDMKKILMKSGQGLKQDLLNPWVILSFGIDTIKDIGEIVMLSQLDLGEDGLDDDLKQLLEAELQTVKTPSSSPLRSIGNFVLDVLVGSGIELGQDALANKWKNHLINKDFRKFKAGEDLSSMHPNNLLKIYLNSEKLQINNTKDKNDIVDHLLSNKVGTNYRNNAAVQLFTKSKDAALQERIVDLMSDENEGNYSDISLAKMASCDSPEQAWLRAVLKVRWGIKDDESGKKNGKTADQKLNLLLAPFKKYWENKKKK